MRVFHQEAEHIRAEQMLDEAFECWRGNEKLSYGRKHAIIILASERPCKQRSRFVERLVDMFEALYLGA